MNKRTAIALFAIVILTWGLNWTVIKLIVNEISPLWSSAFRCIIAAATALAVQCATRQFIIPQKRDIPVILLIGIFNMTIGSFCIAAGVQLTPVGRSVVLGYTTPLWVTPGAWLFLRERPPLRRLIGIAAGMCGIFVLCGIPSPDQEHGSAMLGYALLLLSALSWAIVILGVRAHVWLSTPFQLLFWQTLPPSVLLSALAFWLEGAPSFSLSPALVLLLAYCGIPGTALAYWAMTVINANLPATTTSLGVLATPVVGILGAVVFLGESVDIPLIAASCLIFGGIAIGTIPPRERSAS
ncbi:MAG: DMT family transporter [Desulfovibrio sp.]|nr:DMT family transporter [Desulfovibrio sp.]